MSEASSGKDLTGLFSPCGIAVIGASSNPEKIGYQILFNLVEGGFEGEIYPINPKTDEILGKKAFASVNDIGKDIGLAVIAIPAPYVKAALEDCAQKGIKNVVVITSGFGEVGKKDEEEELKRIADENGMSLVGPNTLGVVYTSAKMNASFGPKDVLPGNIAFISQSGALAISLMGWTMMERIGLAALVSLGNKADVGEKELIEYFNHDEQTQVIVIYMEGIKDGRQFMQTEIKKPVVCLKVGRSQRGAKAAASHTGSLSGSDKIYDAAFRQIGILRADTFTEAFAWSRALSLPVPAGDEAVIITNGGGIGVAATDECEKYGVKLLDDPDWLEEQFRPTMPDYGSTKNPVDITGGAHGDKYGKAARVAFESDKVGSVIILYCETAVTDPLEIAKSLEGEYTRTGRSKPLVISMVGGERSREALHFLDEKGIPAYTSVDEAVSALDVLYRWREIRQNPREKIGIPEAPDDVKQFLSRLKSEGREALLEHEAREVMEKCGVPTPKWGFASSLDEALEKADGMYPLAMKVASHDILHKTDVGGVAVNIRDAEELKQKYEQMMATVKDRQPDAEVLGVNLVQMVKGIECIVGMSRDPQFGPVIMFGLGGVFVEALKDVTFRVVPFAEREAEKMLDEIKARKILKGFRGMQAHRETLVKTLMAIQKLAPLVKEIDINPLLTDQQGSFAVDARIIL
ncbi:MAG: acetate--CoA ligase family protein [Candidatus Omnitrophota bacterium]